MEICAGDSELLYLQWNSLTKLISTLATTDSFARIYANRVGRENKNKGIKMTTHPSHPALCILLLDASDPGL
jgi:hypothetical protein